MKDRIAEYIQKDLLQEPTDAGLDTDENLLGSGILDSVGMMSLVVFIETDLGVAVPPEDVTIENFRSIDTIALYVERRKIES